jgi:hypothetical protein
MMSRRDPSPARRSSSGQSPPAGAPRVSVGSANGFDGQWSPTRSGLTRSRSGASTPSSSVKKRAASWRASVSS